MFRFERLFGRPAILYSKVHNSAERTYRHGDSPPSHPPRRFIASAFILCRVIILAGQKAARGRPVLAHSGIRKLSESVKC